MSQSEWFTTYLEYENLKDMLNVMLYTSQSFITITPLLYYITYHDKSVVLLPIIISLTKNQTRNLWNWIR
jgi:hypothetical protein